jgi:hypothetical protein
VSVLLFTGLIAAGSIVVLVERAICGVLGWRPCRWHRVAEPFPVARARRRR